MQTKTDECSCNTSDKDYHALLIALGVKPHLLKETQHLDLAILYDRVYSTMDKRPFNHPLQCTGSWQLEALAGLGESYQVVDYNSKERDNSGATAIHYAAWSGKKEVLDWINTYYKEALRLEDGYGTPIYYAVLSGKKEDLDWINTHHKEMLLLKDNAGKTFLHHVAFSVKKEALDWINIHHQEALRLKDNSGATAFHYAAQYGNKEALDWINIHHKVVLRCECLQTEWALLTLKCE